ncbi:hypothetical protein LTR54_018268, partial [Friedmanniomyces endolithicus]
VQANGGRVVKLEAQATYIIADHLRVGCPPGSISYTFIDSANKDGALPNPDDHPAGPLPGAIREVGSVSAPGKQTRTAFTAEDDWVLWQWVERARSEGGMVKGNDIYKQLEAKDPRHTFQAWRDRYIKQLMDKPPPLARAGTTAPPSAPREPDEEEGQVLRADFTQDELDHLMSEAANIRAAVRRSGKSYWEETVYLRFQSTPAYAELLEKEKREAEQEEQGEEKPRLETVDETMTHDIPVGTEGSASQQSRRKTSISVSASQLGRKRRTSDFPELFVDKEAEEASQAFAIFEVRQSSKKHDQRTRSPAPEDEFAPIMSGVADADQRLPADHATVHDNDDDGFVVQGDPVAASDLPRPDLNRAAELQIRRESRHGHRATSQQLPWELGTSSDKDEMQVDETRVSDLPTSEINWAVERQIRRESGDNGDTVTKRSSPLPQDQELPTSNDNLAAEQQLRRESGEDLLVDEYTEGRLNRDTASEQREEENGARAYLPVQNDTVVESADAQDDGPSYLTQLEDVLGKDLAAVDSTSQALPSQGHSVTGHEQTSEGEPQTSLEGVVLSVMVHEIDDEANAIVISTHLVEDSKVADGLPREEIHDHDEGAETVKPRDDANESDDEYNEAIMRSGRAEPDEIAKVSQLDEADGAATPGDALTEANFADTMIERCLLQSCIHRRRLLPNLLRRW